MRRRQATSSPASGRERPAVITPKTPATAITAPTSSTTVLGAATAAIATLPTRLRPFKTPKLLRLMPAAAAVRGPTLATKLKLNQKLRTRFVRVFGIMCSDLFLPDGGFGWFELQLVAAAA